MSRTLAGALAALMLLPASAAAARRPALAAIGASALEGASVTFVVKLRADRSATKGKVEVRYATRAGTATAGADFRPRSGVLKFKPGQRRKRVKVRTIGDALTESDERFSLRLSDASKAKLRRRRASALIRDDDPLITPPGNPAGPPAEPPPQEQPDPPGPGPGPADATPPPAPTLNAAAPPSPANDATPLISGTAEAGSTVRIYTASGCSGTHAVEGSAEQYAAGIEVPVATNAITTISTRAFDASGNGSGCSADLFYEHDGQSPATPALTVAPGGPGEVVLTGTADVGSVVRLFAHRGASPACDTARYVYSLSAAQFGSEGHRFDTGGFGDWQFSADSLDQANNVSACDEA
jgi:hypothetical protein